MKHLAILGPEKGPGQLGMLLAIEANRIFCEKGEALKIVSLGSGPAPEWCDEYFYTSPDDLKELEAISDIATFETESLPPVFEQALPTKLLPNQEALKIFQNRFQEKTFLNKLGLNTAPFWHLKDCSNSREEAALELNRFKDKFNTSEKASYRLKTCELGYDGHGQIALNNIDELEAAWGRLGCVEAVLESKVEIFRELSVIASRSANKEKPVIFFETPDNLHKKGVLYRSRSAKLSKSLRTKLEETALTVLEKLDYTGTICLEVFQLSSAEGDLLINEVAPRVHNSGHYSLNFYKNTNQFAAHIKAINGFHLEPPIAKYKYFSMTNLLGIKHEKFQLVRHDLLESGLLPEEQIGFYWYNKEEAKPMRKMGHITLVSNNLKKLKEAEEILDTVLN
ncbi:MAG TPA: ATP-grasp domain-containing protein [Vampirovibrionales bacterium]